METTVTITGETRTRLAELQAAMRPERGGRAVSVDEAINRALDRSEELSRRLAEEYQAGYDDATQDYARDGGASFK